MQVFVIHLDNFCLARNTQDYDEKIVNKEQHNYSVPGAVEIIGCRMFNAKEFSKIEVEDSCASLMKIITSSSATPYINKYQGCLWGRQS